MGRRIKRLSGLEIDEVSLVDRPANQHGVVAIAKSQESGMSPIYDAEGYQVSEEELEHGDFVYDDDGNELVFLADDPGESEQEYEYEDQDQYESVGKGLFGGVSNARNAASKVGWRHTAETYGQQGKKALGGARSSAGARGASAYGSARSSAPGQHVLRNSGRYQLGAAGVGAAGAGGTGYGLGRRGTKSASLGDEVMESLSKSFTDEDRNEVIAKAMDYMQEVADRNSQLEEEVANIQAERDVEDYYELAKSYDIPADSDEIGELMWRASQVLPQEDVEMLDRIFTATGEFSKAYYDEVGYTGGYEAGSLGEIYATAGEVVAKAQGGLTQEQAVTALFEANPAAYDEYEAEQRYSR